MQPIQGLSRRQQSKLERLLKTDEAQKQSMHKKSYRRRPEKSTSIRTPPSRKMFNTLDRNGEENSQSEDISCSVHKNEEKNDNLEGEKMIEKGSKKQFKIPTYLNEKFPLEGGRYEWIQEKASCSITLWKYLIENEDEIKSINCLRGAPLEKLKGNGEKVLHTKMKKQFSEVKEDIYELFDDKYKELINEWSLRK